MIVLFGSHGYIGSAFAAEMKARGIEFMAGDYRKPEIEIPVNAELVINCAAFIPKESVALCDQHPSETVVCNMLLPKYIASKCADTGVPFAQVSTGCLWSDGMEHSEDDIPQRVFNGHCGFYIGTKATAEGLVREALPDHYIWRVRLPFDELDSDRNYLSKLATFPEVWDHDNSLSHRGDFVKACLDMWEMRAPFGTYSVCNTGHITARSIVSKMMSKGLIKREPEFVPGSCNGTKLINSKLLSTGVKIRTIDEAVSESIEKWNAK